MINITEEQVKKIKGDIVNTFLGIDSREVVKELEKEIEKINVNFKDSEFVKRVSSFVSIGVDDLISQQVINIVKDIVTLFKSIKHSDRGVKELGIVKDIESFMCTEDEELADSFDNMICLSSIRTPIKINNIKEIKRIAKKYIEMGGKFNIKEYLDSKGISL